jgi:hypothetical protein
VPRRTIRARGPIPPTDRAPTYSRRSCLTSSPTPRTVASPPSR